MLYIVHRLMCVVCVVYIIIMFVCSEFICCSYQDFGQCHTTKWLVCSMSIFLWQPPSVAAHMMCCVMRANDTGFDTGVDWPVLVRLVKHTSMCRNSTGEMNDGSATNTNLLGEIESLSTVSEYETTADTHAVHARTHVRMSNRTKP